MRGNSGFLRRITFGIFTTYFLILTVECGPARPRRMMRETYANPETQIFKNDTQSTEKDTCNYNGKEIARASVICDQKPGCLAIQSHGACCPEYQCDCKRDGKIYENGEKIVDPETPCRVCICRGGEINCNSVTCYNRNDCKPKFIVGRCCPEYDNCPPLENVKISFSKETESEEKFSLKSTTTVKPQKEDEIPSSTTEIDIKIQLPDNPLGIKIKEITKTGEIRITDDRPKIYKPTKSSEITQSAERKFSSTTTPSASSITISLPEENSVEVNDSSKNNENFDKLEPGNIEEQNELEHDYGNTKGDELGSNKNIRQVDNTTNDIKRIEPTVSTSEENTDNSDVSGMASSTSSQDLTTAKVDTDILDSKEKRDPIVVVLNHSGQAQSIVVVDADGLQKVDEPIDEQEEEKHRKTNAIEKVFIVHASSESTPSPIEISSESSMENGSTVSPKFSSSEMITKNQVFETSYYEPITNGPFDVTSKDIFQNDLLHSTKNPYSTEDQIHLVSSSESGQSIEEQGFYILDSATDRSSSASHRTYSMEVFGTDDPNLHMIPFETNYYTTPDQIEGSSPYDYSPNHRISSTEYSTTSDGPSPSIENDIEDDVENNENPAYPLLPDDISLYGTMQNEDHDGGKHSDKNDNEKTEPKILLDVLPLRSNNTQSQNDPSSTTQAPEDWLKSSNTSTSEIMFSTTQSTDKSANEHTTEHLTEGSASIEVENRHNNLSDKSSSVQTFSDETLSSTSPASYSSSTESEEYESIGQENPSIDDPQSNYFFQLAKDFIRYQSNILNS